MYLYRREDDGEVVEVDFETAMSQQAGYITLPDGVSARRIYESTGEKSATPRTPIAAVPLSDAMGCTAAQVGEMASDAKRHGFTGVEFVQDKTEPTFYQAKFSSWAEWDRYRKHRHLVDKNSRNGSGAALCPATFERAKARVLEQFNENNGSVMVDICDDLKEDDG